MTALLWPMAAHVAWAALLYALLTFARAPAVWRVGRPGALSDAEARISANLSNQFEWPVLFHVACLLWMQAGATPAAVALAWLFVGGRVLHTGVQVGTRNVRLRGIVFTVNFVAVLALWALLLVRNGPLQAS